MTLEELVYRKYNERQKIYKESILTGVENWNEYQRLIGYLLGMSDFLGDIDPLIRDPDSAAEEEDK